jgi:hypothetical protein
MAICTEAMEINHKVPPYLHQAVTHRHVPKQSSDHPAPDACIGSEEDKRCELFDIDWGGLWWNPTVDKSGKAPVLPFPQSMGFLSVASV